MSVRLIGGEPQVTIWLTEHLAITKSNQNEWFVGPQRTNFLDMLQVAKLRGSVVWRLKESAIMTNTDEMKKTHPDNAKCAAPPLNT